MRVCPAVGLDGGRLTTPDELGSAAAEQPPAAQRVFAGAAIRVGVPAFHRMDAPAVTDLERANLARLRQRRTGLGGENLVIDGQLAAERGQPLPQGIDVLKLSNLGVRFVHAGRKSCENVGQAAGGLPPRLSR